MKKIIFFVFSVAFLLSCNQGSNKNEANGSTTNGKVETSELTLNNGAKWQSDSNTNRHLVRIKTMVNMFKIAPFPAAEKYQILGSDLQASLDTMIQDCTLKGAPDEALHKWMNPILRQVRELKNVSDTAIARPIFDSVHQRVNIYYDYFE